ncbi:DUF421 domain-containing protein [Bacillus changyiensis]|uniref:DUF421 domain-containing protein n=1 Tax=Bacillus changyiensis TaxID=3004103 RepID=UPI0022E3D9C9|nr:DUF421 domain-containing protein [Bacillus changyiensis]MDA1475834.1 DUF421 domain-containing protein [Bacillus changyiensis]
MNFEYLWIFLLKPALVFTTAYILFRMAGKKAVSQMSNFDLLLTFAIGTIISEPILTSKLSVSIYYAVIFLVFYLFIEKLSLHNKWRWFLVVQPTVLIRNGDIDEKGLKKERLTVNELLGKLREKGYADPYDIDLALIEESGQISVIPKANARPIQPRDLNLQTARNFVPIPLILDGEIIEHNLKYLKLTKQWLFHKLSEKGIQTTAISSIMLGTLNEKNEIMIDQHRSQDVSTGNPYLYKPGDDG